MLSTKQRERNPTPHVEFEAMPQAQLEARRVRLSPHGELKARECKRQCTPWRS
ncbi:UNVERIFIED_CONTAM: hypothetical protein Sradi_4131000 [Sesamum radiatum]|uniref:Uncharacterized protein n=1 Tax=Sesamum radiatum TaxID=300843 RepID=A0AAW2P3A6_SESRA